MAQALKERVPAFCLACIGTDNKFRADLVLKRWKYISTKCSKRGIKVISFGADGDSHEMKAMQFSTQKCLLKQSSSKPSINVLSEWYNWFAERSLEKVAYVQDVHVAVKLKARLLTKSIILPIGKHVAGVHDLHLIKYFW